MSKYNIVFHWLHVKLLLSFFTYEKGVLDFLGWCLSKTAFTICWRMKVAILSFIFSFFFFFFFVFFFLKEIQDK